MRTLLTSKERMMRSLRGEKSDLLPAAPCYLSLYLADRLRAAYIEQYRLRMGGRTCYQVDHTEDTNFRARALYRAYETFRSPPDWIEVETGASKSWAERTEIILQDGILSYHDTQADEYAPMYTIPMPRGDVLLSDLTQVTYDVWDRLEGISSQKDADAQLPIIGAEEWLARGDFDLPRQVARDCGDRFFISTILDTPFSDLYDFLGFRGLMVIQRRNPQLFQNLLQRKLMQSKELMQAWAATGIHGVFAEEVFTGTDSISPASYDRFVFAYNQPYFQFMRSLGLFPIHYVCGDALPRLKRMIEYDIAAVAFEESKKKFCIDIAEIVEQAAGRTAVFGNIDTIRFGLQATPQEMDLEVKRQSSIGMQARGFIVGTGSPFPLETDPAMIDTLVESAHS